MSSYIQSNTQRGSIIRNGSVDFTGKRGYLANLTDTTGEALASLPTADGAICQFIVEDVGLPTVVTNYNASGISAGSGLGASGVQLIPLESSRNIRMVASGTIAGGAKVMAANGGKIKAAAGAAVWIVGVTEEDAVDGQYVLVRPCVAYVASGGY